MSEKDWSLVVDSHTMRPSMGFEHLLRFIFVLYCATVGIILVLAPWTPGWEILVSRLPFPGLRFLEMTWWRGGLTGFGLVHLVWGVHDLNELLKIGYPRDEAHRPENSRHQ